ncbi:hypothetical protein D1O90_005024 [Escherichia coli]|nr:hypothetical protein [Escherichia coli]
MDDMAKASVHVMELGLDAYQQVTQPTLSHINVGYGSDLSILELAQLVAQTVGYSGSIQVDPSKPDGTPQKLMNIERLKAMGWAPETTLADGLQKAYIDFQHSTRV